MASESISRLLGRNAEILPLREQLERIERLQERYRTVAPERLRETSRVCAIDGTTVVICAASGTVASVLRHLAPRILEALQSKQDNSKHPEDQELNQIRVEVQVVVPQPKRPVVSRGELPHDRLDELAARLGEGPLKEELKRIAREAQARSTRSKM